MQTYKLDSVQVMRILSLVEERRTKVLRQVDSLRKLQGSIDDDLFDFFSDGNQGELRDLKDIEQTLSVVE